MSISQGIQLFLEFLLYTFSLHSGRILIEYYMTECLKTSSKICLKGCAIFFVQKYLHVPVPLDEDKIITVKNNKEFEKWCTIHLVQYEVFFDN